MNNFLEKTLMWCFFLKMMNGSNSQWLGIIIENVQSINSLSNKPFLISDIRPILTSYSCTTCQNLSLKKVLLYKTEECEDLTYIKT